ncbi:MAG: isocitrate lyase/PEP mutase family protein [Jatrophihabitans sp.]|uniref:isocitrate lyase/PEP mutase family protein n=1 Tax=Jatrophihabitans sp. TaxID=1932789 RepID=UPI003F81AA00
MSTDLAAKASALLALHQPGNPVVLPTVWDAWSARLAEKAGFQGLTVGSHPLADSLGRADGEGMTFDEVLTRVRQITESVALPVSVDIESGYGQNAATLIGGLLAAGAVGLNIEDTVHGEGGRLRSAEEHADLVGRLRQAADAAGVEFVINARTDLFKNKDGDDETRVDRAIERLNLCVDAGARSAYPVGFHDEATYQRLTGGIKAPVNAIANPAEGDLEMFRRAGVGRISFGPIWQMNLAARAEELLARWK